MAQGDTLHIVVEDFGPSDAIGYYRSADGGLTWSNLTVLSDDSCQTLFPRIIGDGPMLMALWKNHFYYIGPISNNIGYSLSSDDGATWTPPQYVLNPSWEHILYFAASGDSQMVHIVLNSQVGDSLVFYSIRSTDFGTSWSIPQDIFWTLASDIPDQFSINNFVHLVWAGFFRSGEAGDVYYIRSTDGGVNWSTNIALSTVDEHPSELASVCGQGDTNLAVCWMDFKYSPYWTSGDILMRSSTDSGLIWDPERQATFSHYAWDSDIASNWDTIHIAWVDEGTGLIHRSIYYTRSTDNGITWDEPYWLDQTLDDSADPALDISNGKVYCVWSDGRPNPDTSVIGGLYLTRWDPEPDAIDENHENLPDRIAFSAYPNPFNSSVIITFSALKGGDIKIYDIKGALVRAFSLEEKGDGKIIWDATDASGKKVSSGTYFAKAETPQKSYSIQLLYLK
jgi:hypothetical protein